MKNSCALCMIIAVSIALTLHTDAATRYAKANGHWSKTDTWTDSDGGRCRASVPTAADVVIIAGNHTVLVDGDDAVCASVQLGGASDNDDRGVLKFEKNSQLTVGGIVTLGADASAAKHYGRLEMATGGTLICGGLVSNSVHDVWMPGTGTVQLTGTGTLPAQKFLSFNNLTLKGGTATLGAPIAIDGVLTLTSGKLISTAEKMLTLTDHASVSGGSGASFVSGPMRQTWRTAAAAKTYPIGKAKYEPFTISLAHPGSCVIQAECFDGNAGGSCVTPLTKISTAHYFQVSVISGKPGTGGSVTLPNDNDIITTATTLVVAQSATPHGTYNGLGTNTGSTASVTSSGFDPSSGEYVLLGTTQAALPVELTAFTATARKAGIVLSWSTATETNNCGFEIQRRSEVAAWRALGFVDGSGTSNTPHAYTFSDAGAAPGTYVYRLKQIDRDGAFDYSSEVEASRAMTAEDYTIAQNYPNPFNPTTTIRFAVPNAEHVSLKVFNVMGQETAVLFDGIAEAGRMHSVVFDATGLASGTYIYQLRTAGRVEVKRMVLLR